MSCQGGEVEARVREMNARLMHAVQSAPPATERPPAVQKAGSAVDRLAERLRKLEALFQAGMVSTQEYDAKRAVILSELWPLLRGESSLALRAGHHDHCPERTGNSPKTGIPPIRHSA